MQPEGTIKQRIRRLHEEKPGNVTIDDLLAVVPSRREQKTSWCFLFAVIRLTFMWPLNSQEAKDIADYVTRRGRFAPGYMHAVILQRGAVLACAMTCRQTAMCAAVGTSLLMVS